MERLYIVVPCYNEQEVLPETEKRLSAKLSALIAAGAVAQDSRILFVDDGSRDRTWELISQYHEESELVEGAKLSRNRGHQNALLAGLMTAKDRCDITISMDADLQDDIDAIDGFLAKRAEGCDIVYGVRNDRTSDTAFKRGTAQTFYKIMSGFGVETVYNHADYRLMSRRALEGLAQYGEVNLFLRGMAPLIGYRSDTVEYSRGERFAGESHYPLSKMLNFAVDGITSLSVKPIRMVFGAGCLFAAGAAVAFLVLLVRAIIGLYISGTALLLASVWFIGGAVLVSLGIVGEYVGKTYLETKSRPRYIIDRLLSH